MWKIMSVLIFGFLIITPAGAQDCYSIKSSMKLPEKIKTRGKPKVARWEDIDKVLNDLTKKLQGHRCSFQFQDLFRIGKEKDDPYFPLTNSGVRIIQEDSLMNLMVYSRDGTQLGVFAGRIKYEKSGNLYAKRSYTQYYFQYKTPSGRIQSVGSELLLDRFLLKWEEIKNRVAVSTE